MAWLVSAGALAFALLGTGSVFAGVAWASRAEPVAAAETPTPTVDPARAVSDQPATASRLRTCSVAGQAADGRLMSLEGYVMRADTGEVLFDRSGSTPARTASVLKVFTAAAAISRLGPDFQITTSVYEGSSPGTIVLVGRGDATLSALPAGQESFYPGAPKLQTLAEQAVAAHSAKYPDTPITQVVLDASYWSSADKWDDSWKRSEQTTGYHSEVTALQVDGDRADPRASTSPRSTDPIARAGAAFVSALRTADPSGDVVDPGVATTLGTAVSSTAIAEVKSQPLRVLINQMLLVSDNTLAEMLARIVSKEAGFGGSASSLQQVIPSELANFGVPPTGLTIRDGSGLSDLNAVPAATMADFMRQVREGANGLDVVRDGLPVAGKSGTLASRFTGDNAVARGNVWAKTGWIDTAYTLAGYLNAADGTPLAFAFYAIGDGIPSTARAALDTLTTAVYRCGDNLSNN
ncbi:D-alanyl-D-alanine carboxypeptidase/D-alanyl-D-alanine-endopeptidase [Schumannella luteola]|nr:D-alanyl-D-alanine carboxypeptidase/D-alanyl-D-alanine-endopeptidase [Schumannella luteola]